MSRKYIFIILILLLAGMVFAFFYFQEKSSQVISNEINKTSENIKSNEMNVIQNSSNRLFFISGWLPYWSKSEGVSSLERNYQIFSEINPFAFSVGSDGNIINKLEWEKSPWSELKERATRNNVAIVPTILWADAKAMHNVFSDPVIRSQHISAIYELLKKNNFPGVDIDYEGKDMADRDNFSIFLSELHQKLSENKKSLSCTVEARTQDLPPQGFSGTRAMSWANDLSALNKNCDSVRLMAYDQVFQVHRAYTFQDVSNSPSAPNADIGWVEETVSYFLRFIDPQKLILGIPTYGWEFRLERIPGGYQYTRLKSVSYPKAMEEAKNAGVKPERSAGGELSFIYKNSSGENIATFSDAESVRQKIELTKKLNLKGISLFKIDGLSDPDLFRVLQEESGK